jgi:ketosteroid isomerase-like protein
MIRTYAYKAILSATVGGQTVHLRHAGSGLEATVSTGRSFRPAVTRMLVQHSTGTEQMIHSRRRSWLAAGAVAILSTTMGFAYAAGSADESAIRTVNVNWGKAYNGGDAKAVTALYADDAVLLPPGAPSAHGKTAILDFYTKDIADTKAQSAELVLACEPGDRSPAACDSQTEVAVSGNMGWEVGYMKVVVKGAVVDTGKWLSVMRKKDGKWELFRDTWNMDTPPAP